MVYRFNMQGTGADGQTWESSGEVGLERPSDFVRVLEQAQLHAFNQLTKGKAVYGQPGVGCRGPYRITKLLVEEIVTS